MRQLKHAANMAKMTNACASFSGKPGCKNQMGGKDIDGRNALRWIYRKQRA